MQKSILTAALMLAFSTVNAQSVDNTVNTNSTSGAISGSNSESRAGASSDNLNVVNPNQSTSLGVGVGITQTFEASEIPTKTRQDFRTNNSVPLAASVSFSSDYCGGTASGGASAAGISIGMAKPMLDGNCQGLRRAEKFGIAAANAHSAGLTSLAVKLIALQAWEICMSETNASPRQGASQPSTQSACEFLNVIDNQLPASSGPDVAPNATQAAAVRKQQESQQPVIIRGSDGREYDPARVPRG